MGKESLSPGRILRFGAFQVNLATREVRKRGVRVRLPGQSFYILSILLERPGEVITREEIRQRLWLSDTFVDFEHSINSAIRKLRAVLGDSAENARYIETVARLGYRFIAPVEDVSDAQPSRGEALTADTVVEPAAQAAEPRAHRWAATLGIVAGIVILTAIYFAGAPSQFRPQHGNQAANKTDVRAQRSESILPHAPALPPSQSAEASDLYRQGMYFWNKRTAGGLREAIVYFQQATAADPNYALAYAGLANSYALLTAYSSAPGSVYVSQARAAAKRALELDENSAEAHTALALILQNYDWDWQSSEKEYRRAIQLNANYATAHQWYAEHLMWLGRFNDALSESDRAQQLDQLSLVIASDHGAILYFSRQYDLAIAQLQTVLSKNPNFLRAFQLLSFSYVEKRMFSQALAATELVRQVYGDGPWYWSIRTYTYGRAGQVDRARRELEKLEKLNRQEFLGPTSLLFAHLGMGDKEEALADLQQAYVQRSNILTTLKVEPAFDSLRGDPRFEDLLRCAGLADKSASVAGAAKP